MKQSKEVQLYGRIHNDICNVPLYLVPGVPMQIKLTKAKPIYSLMNKDAESKTVFKFLDAKLMVNRVTLIRRSCWLTISFSKNAFSHATIYQSRTELFHVF